MLKNIEDTLHKTCLIGLSYFNVQGQPLKQNILAGRVIAVDNEKGLTVALLTDESPLKSSSQNAHFILPNNLSCWFTAPKGEFHTSQTDVKIINPDYLVTWDIHQLKNQPNKAQSNKQQWWQWRPRIQAPNVG